MNPTNAFPKFKAIVIIIENEKMAFLDA